MYLLFKSVDASHRGIIQLIGSWMEYSIGFLPDTHIQVVDYTKLNATVISEDVAYSWMFFGAARPYISVRDGTPQNERLRVLRSEEATGTKIKYNLTDQDIQNTVILMQSVMRLILDEYYDKLLLNLNLSVSTLEYNTWAQQKREADAFSSGDTNLVLLESLANARNITLEEMVLKVNSAISIYNNNLIELLSSKQAIEKEIKACVNIQDCNRILHKRFNVEMPVLQKTDEGLEQGATFNL